jgi:hypothetical protein
MAALICLRSRSTVTTWKHVTMRDFLGDRITKAAFRDVIDHLRKLLRKKGEDPLSDDPTEDLSKKNAR